jgi:hypothetical protein
MIDLFDDIINDHEMSRIERSLWMLQRTTAGVKERLRIKYGREPTDAEAIDVVLGYASMWKSLLVCLESEVGSKKEAIAWVAETIQSLDEVDKARSEMSEQERIQDRDRI